MKDEFTTIYMSLVKVIWKETELKSEAHQNMIYAAQSAKIAEANGETNEYLIMHKTDQFYQLGKESAYEELRKLLEKAMIEREEK